MVLSSRQIQIKELAQCPGGVKNVEVAYVDVATDVDNELAAISAMAAKVGMEITLKKMALLPAIPP